MVEIVPKDRLAGSPAWERLIDAVRDQARDDAAGAAGDWQQNTIGGRASGDTAETARRVLAGIDDGDPAILDGLPSADLSGEWADGITPQTLFQGHRTGELPEWFYDLPDWAQTEIGDAYRDVYDETAETDVAAACRAALPD